MLYNTSKTLVNLQCYFKTPYGHLKIELKNEKSIGICSCYYSCFFFFLR